MLHKSLSALVIAACAGIASADRVDLFMFEDNGVNPLIVDLWVDVVDNGATVDFIFHNDSADGAVSSIYFENNNISGSLLANGSITGSTGDVDFSVGATPPNPPGSISGFGGNWGGNLFAVDADSPPPFNGINPGETLTISFDLIGSFHNILSALNNPEQGFRIAQHAISFDEQSIWTVNVVPAPGAIAVLGFGGLLAGRRRR